MIREVVKNVLVSRHKLITFQSEQLTDDVDLTKFFFKAVQKVIFITMGQFHQLYRPVIMTSIGKLVCFSKSISNKYFTHSMSTSALNLKLSVITTDP